MEDTRKLMLLDLLDDAPTGLLERWGVEYETTYNKEEAEEIVKKWGDNGYVVREVSDSGNDYWCCYNLPEWSAEEIANFRSVLTLRQLKKTEGYCHKIYYWVLFWSVLSLVAILLYFVL